MLSKSKYPALQAAINNIFENLVKTSTKMSKDAGTGVSSPEYYLHIMDSSDKYFINIRRSQDLYTPYHIQISQGAIEFLMTDKDGNIDILNGLKKITGVLAHEIAHSYDHMGVDGMSLDPKKASPQTIELFTDQRGSKIAFNAGYPQDTVYSAIKQLNIIEGQTDKTRKDVLEESAKYLIHSHPEINLRETLDQAEMLSSRMEQGDNGDDLLRKYITPDLETEVKQLKSTFVKGLSQHSITKQMNKVNKILEEMVKYDAIYDYKTQLMIELDKTFTLLKDESVSKELIDDFLEKIVIPISNFKKSSPINLDDNILKKSNKIPLFQSSDYRLRVKEIFQKRLKEVDRFAIFKKLTDGYIDGKQVDTVHDLTYSRLFLTEKDFIETHKLLLDEVNDMILSHADKRKLNHFEIFKYLSGSEYKKPAPDNLFNILVEQYIKGIEENCDFKNCLNILGSPFRDWNSTPITSDSYAWSKLKDSNLPAWKRLEEKYLKNLWENKGEFAISDLFNAREATYDWDKISSKVGGSKADLKKDVLKFIKSGDFDELIRNSTINDSEEAFIEFFLKNNKFKDYELSSTYPNDGRFAPSKLDWIDEDIFNEAIKKFPKESKEYYLARRLLYVHQPNLYRKHLKANIKNRINNALKNGQKIEVDKIWAEAMTELYGSTKYPPAYSVDIFYESIDQSDLSKRAKSKLILDNTFLAEDKLDKPSTFGKRPLKRNPKGNRYKSLPNKYGMMGIHEYRHRDNFFEDINHINRGAAQATPFERLGDLGTNEMRRSNFNIILKNIEYLKKDNVFKDFKILEYLLDSAKLAGDDVYVSFIHNHIDKLLNSSLSLTEKSNILNYIMSHSDANPLSSVVRNNKILRKFISTIDEMDIPDFKKVEMFLNAIGTGTNTDTDEFIKRVILPRLKRTTDINASLNHLVIKLLNKEKVENEGLKIELFNELNRQWHEKIRLMDYSIEMGAPGHLRKDDEFKNVKLSEDFTVKFESSKHIIDFDRVPVKDKYSPKTEIEGLEDTLRRLHISSSTKRDELIEKWVWDNKIDDLQQLAQVEKLKTTSTINISELPVRRLSGISNYLSNLNLEQRKTLIEYILRSEHMEFPDSLLNLAVDDYNTTFKFIFENGTKGLSQEETKNFIKEYLENFIKELDTNEKTLLNNFIFNTKPPLLDDPEYFKFVVSDHLKLNDNYTKMLTAYLNTPPLDEKSTTISYLLSLPSDEQEKGFLKIFDAFKVIGPKAAQTAPDFDFFNKEINSQLDEYKDSTKAMSKYDILKEMDNNLPQKIRAQIKGVKSVLGSASIKTVVLLEMVDGTERVAAFKNPNAVNQIKYHITRAENYLKQLEKSDVKFSKNLVENYIFHMKNLLNEEIDFKLEKKKLKTSAEVYEKINTKMEKTMNDWKFHVPSSDDKLGVHENILFMEKGEGITFRKLDRAIQEEIGPHIVESSLRSMFEYGHFDPDRHSGNFLVNPKTKTIYPIDFGQSQKFAPNNIFKLADERFIFVQFLRHLKDGNIEEVLKHYNKMADKKIDINQSLIDKLTIAVAGEKKSSEKIIKVLNLLSEEGGFLKKPYLFGLKGLLTLSRNGYVTENQFKNILSKQATAFLEKHITLNIPILRDCLMKMLQ
ncbi:MAG: hypothetical protein A2417_02585 [Bdellovibrionales bacterium RIFOXYC1_FULL_37_79]|nr:MAG: hypothetical protein A2417_02585 [Bdellovibrionales bacterium RIFOXYC1_FULL_37_79]